MKTGIHPKYFDAAEIKCSCGNVMIVGSTRESLRTELCSKCHPFYTGQQKLVDTAGRVDKFQEKRKKSAQLLEETRQRAEAKKVKPEAYKEREIPQEVLARAMKQEANEGASKEKWGKPLGETLTEEVKKEDKVKAPKAEKVSAKKAAAKSAPKAPKPAKPVKAAKAPTKKVSKKK